MAYMAHIHEKIDFTASVYIVFKNKVLLHKHKKLGIWLQPGGHIELDEDPNEAALREAKEEALAAFTEPQSWTDFRKRYAETGDPWLPNTPNAPDERRPE